MAQRAALARVLVNEPALLLLDEPLGQLDALTRLSMQRELLRLWDGGGFTVLLVTHDVDEALFLADRVIVLSARPGRILGDVAVEVPRPRHHDDLRFHDLRRRVLHLLGIDCECGPGLASCHDSTPEAGLSGAARQTADHSAGVSADFSWSELPPRRRLEIRTAPMSGNIT
jgi:energy-coupling factor transporter ATP-binding protein EcfA2